MLTVPPRTEANSMQGPGQPGMMPGSAGYQALLYQVQAGQFAGSGSANTAPRLALVHGGARPAAMNAAALAAAAAGGASFRPPGAQMPMGMLLKAPARKTGGAQPKGRKHCNCKNSRCLKLYCECFASGRYCDNCNCVTCFNNKESEAVRQSAVEAILERNPNAFRPKIQTAEGDTHPQSIRNAPDGTVRHTKGCNCKKSACLKKYCECFQGGIFCTEVCKCVDCKNYDGSEARAQVLSIQEPFNMHQLHQAAAQHALKRPRMQMPQAAMQQGQAAGLLQAQSAYQQLAAAAAAGGQAAQAVQPLQQLQAMSAPQQVVAQPMQAVSAAPAVTPAPQQPSYQPQQPSRHPLLDVVHDLVKPELIEELGQLLVLVAKEEADKQHQLHQQPSQVQQQEQLEPLAADGHAAVTASTVLKQELNQAAATEAAELQADSDLQETAAKRARSISPSGVGVVEQKTAVVKLEPAADADGDSPMHETVPLNEPKQSIELEQGPVADAGSPAADSEESVSEAYAAQEAVVLQEFNAILQRIVAQAEKKSSSLAAAAAAPGPAGQAQLVTAASTASTDASDLQAQQQRQHQLAQAPQQLQQQLAQQQVQQSQPMVQQQRQPLLTMPQQAMMLQANNNLAYAQLQQAQRHAAFVQAGGQPMAAYPGGLGMQMAGLRPMGLGMQQMVQVMAQDGTVHQIPASSLMQLQLAAAAQAQQAAAPVPQQIPQQLPQQQATPAAAAANGSASATAGLGVSLLSLLNGTNGSGPNSQQ